ncbi:hypothetical protein NESM_000835200 [Novymonas esmeraldas]|uniref:MutL C-terminal dimerisation domain-containing protein n=1 Tax=Novymonas esmeraldas TaxID=1808958 RepID=A0AAW0EYX6_9TRYP
MDDERIQRLPAHDAAVLRASYEFPTFTDAFARVTQVALPALEAAALRRVQQSAPPSHGGGSGGGGATAHDSLLHNVAVSLCLPALAWDVTRVSALPPSAAVPALLPLISTPQPPPSWSSAELEPLCRLATLCTDVSVSVRLEVEVAVDSAGDGDPGLPVAPTPHRLCHVLSLLPETRWRCGDRLADAEAHGHHRRRSDHNGGHQCLLSQTGVSPHTRAAGHPHRVRLVTVCRVRGVFYSLPVRHTPFTALLGGGGAAADLSLAADRHGARWACSSASAVRTRREEQQHLVTTLFQTAVCTLVAPLYLGDSGALSASPPHIVPAVCVTFLRECDADADASGVGRPLRPSRCTSADRSPCGEPAAAVAGLRVGRRGLYCGTVRARQSAPHLSRVDAVSRRCTPGEATARHVCRTFGVSVRAPSHTARPRVAAVVDDAEEVERDGVLREVVVRPGRFAVLFITAAQPADAAPPTHTVEEEEEEEESTRASALPPVHHGAPTVMILVKEARANAVQDDRRHCGAAAAAAAAAPCCGVLDPAHWAYDVVAAAAAACRHGRCGGGKAPAGWSRRVVPMFVFVDRAYVPERLCEARQRRGAAAETFAQLYEEALLCLFHDTMGSREDCGRVSRGEPATMHAARSSLVAADPPSSASAPPCGPAAQQPAAVQSRVRYLCQRVLEAAAAAGPASSTLAAPSSSTATRAGALLPVRLHPTSLLSYQSTAPASAVSVAAGPRRTPVIFDPQLRRVAVEEEEQVQAAVNAGAVASGARSPPRHDRTAASAAGLARMRRLLDTGRGCVLRRLPHAFAAPRSWVPARGGGADTRCSTRMHGECASSVAEGAAPPAGSAITQSVAVVQWARKFIVLACPAATRSTDSPGTACVGAQPHALQWWVADQHAVHERVRLELFLCFADTYVCHPELRGPQRTDCPASGDPCNLPTCLSPYAQAGLRRRRCIARLLGTLADPRNASLLSPSSTPSFSVSLPAQWRQRVTAVEGHLRHWGWRFHHDFVDAAPRRRVAVATAVAAWPCVEVEGVVRHATTLQALWHTVEELESVGAATTETSSQTGPPSPSLIPSVFLDFFISRSCRGAIMFGDQLRPTAARTMLAALECVAQYHVCSHGRPSFARLAPAT